MRPLAFLLLFLFSSSSAAQAARAPAPATKARTTPAAPSIPVDEIRRYMQVLSLVEQSYVDPLKSSDLFDASLRGLLQELDPHSTYLDKEEMQELLEFSSGTYQGIGVEVEFRKERGLAIVAPIDGSPAAKAGLRPGDVITAIDGKAVKGSNVNNASLGLRGKPGTNVRLNILREGEAGTLEVLVMRELIKFDSIKSRLLEPGYGYVRISTFQEDTGRRMVQEVRAMSRSQGGTLKGLVIDMRSNPGGLLDSALQIADAFLESGVIVSTRGRMPESNLILRATPGDILAGAPIIVLVDVGSASASEVVAGALRDQKRALIMGSRTFGKGSVQKVFPMTRGDGIKPTISRYYTPNGKSIQANGITPDVVVSGTTKKSMREQDLAGHLVGDQEQEDGFSRGETITGDDIIGRALARLKLANAPRFKAKK